MSFGITELVIILVIVLLLFGTSKLKSLGSDLGSAIKGFRNAVGPEEDAKTVTDEGEEVPSTLQQGEQAKSKP
ncbi:MAG: twin-arginine translocase TatA/TatE family subunit [Gammaproteobacteria bacterium]|jgi:sec-independent protein translocase protein TatA|nr:twin-arginine translocase TatA/TatE family subunit [Gammaproteobacteria bacterium]|tara:strand:- start:147 stop:365 length:219 start_codon:yes stop_codon:yes gene_type:complete